MPKIKYVKKERLYPAFGLADPKKDIAYVRKDLPKRVQKFVLAHELHHLKDYKKLKKQGKKYNIIFEEFKSNFSTLFKYPIGFIYTIILSLHPTRLKLYWELYVSKNYNYKKFNKQLNSKK